MIPSSNVSYRFSCLEHSVSDPSYGSRIRIRIWSDALPKNNNRNNTEAHSPYMQISTIFN